ncbi:uncharacterized protein [Rhodnius prolixus]|uniref:Uncharacterized protein n=1 Tax=Rhodnius prolixus TaxID=13249 RepID=T1HBP9_RHOPR
MKDSLKTVIFSIVLVHSVVNGAPNIFTTGLSYVANYTQEKISKTGQAIGQVFSLVNGTAQLPIGVTSQAAYMTTSTGKAAVTSTALFGQEVVSETVDLSNKILDLINTIIGSIPIVGSATNIVTAATKWTLDAGQTVSLNLFNGTESIGRAVLTGTNTVAQITTGIVGGAVDVIANIGGKVANAISSLINSGIGTGLQYIPGIPVH